MDYFRIPGEISDQVDNRLVPLPSMLNTIAEFIQSSNNLFRFTLMRGYKARSSHCFAGVQPVRPIAVPVGPGSSGSSVGRLCGLAAVLSRGGYRELLPRRLHTGATHGPLRVGHDRAASVTEVKTGDVV